MDKDELRKKMFELRLSQTYYMMEHKEDNPELRRELIQLRREYAKELAKEKGLINEGESKNVKR